MDVSNIFGYILYLSGIPFWFDAITTTVRHVLGADHCREMYLSSAQARVSVATEARWYLTLYLAVRGDHVYPLEFPRSDPGTILDPACRTGTAHYLLG